MYIVYITFFFCLRDILFDNQLYMPECLHFYYMEIHIVQTSMISKWHISLNYRRVLFIAIKYGQLYLSF